MESVKDGLQWMITFCIMKKNKWTKLLQWLEHCCKPGYLNSVFTVHYVLFSCQGCVRGVSPTSLLVESVVSARRFDAKDNDLLQASTWCRSLCTYYNSVGSESQAIVTNWNITVCEAERTEWLPRFIHNIAPNQVEVKASLHFETLVDLIVI